MWSRTAWSHLWSGWAVWLLTDDMEEDGDDGGLVGFSTARTVHGEEGAGTSSASESFFQRSAISTWRAAILAKHVVCSLLGGGAVLGGQGPDGGEGAVTTMTFCNPHLRIPETSASFPSPQAQSRNLTLIPNSERPFPIMLDHSQPDRLYLSLVSSSSLSLTSSHTLPLSLSRSLCLTLLVLHLRQPYTT